MSPYQRIMKAARDGKGIRLSADEVRQLAEDDAIQQVATEDDERDIASKERT